MPNLVQDDPTSERRMGPTPNGGASSEVYYQSASGAPAPKSLAVKGEVVEFNEAGVEIARTYFKIEKPKANGDEG